MSILEAHHLTIGYRHIRQQEVVVASDLSLALHAGELVCLLGPNGAGKSTLMRTLAGMQPALSGQVRLMGDAITALHPQERARRLSIVLTDRMDVGTLSAYALVALGRYPYTNWQGRLTEQDEMIVRWAIEAVGAQALAQRSVNELSDGERQKIMIARALAQEPQVMLLDEPTAFLDLPHRVEVMRILLRLARETNRAILVSTHDLDLALRSADKIWLMPQHGQLQIGAPEDLVMSGAFEAAFHGVAFDRHTGTFNIHTPSIDEIYLEGEGIPRVWTERALQRAGFRITANPSDPAFSVMVIAIDDNPRWQFLWGDSLHEADSIENLIQFIKNAMTDHPDS